MLKWIKIKYVIIMDIESTALTAPTRKWDSVVKPALYLSKFVLD